LGLQLPITSPWVSTALFRHEATTASGASDVRSDFGKRPSKFEETEFFGGIYPPRGVQILEVVNSVEPTGQKTLALWGMVTDTSLGRVWTFDNT
jgi:hypothetical protein